MSIESTPRHYSYDPLLKCEYKKTCRTKNTESKNTATVPVEKVRKKFNLANSIACESVTKLIASLPGM